MKTIHYPGGLEFKFNDESKDFILYSDDFFNADDKPTAEEYREYLDETTNLTEEEKEFVISELETYEWID